MDWWAIKLIFCDVLNLVNIIINLFVMDWYLGKQFFDYGPVAMNYIFTDFSQRGTTEVVKKNAKII